MTTQLQFIIIIIIIIIIINSDRFATNWRWTILGMKITVHITAMGIYYSKLNTTAGPSDRSV